MKVKEVMKKYVITVDKDTTVSTVSKIMTNNKIGSVIVLDAQRPIGIITNDDVVDVVAKNMDPKEVKVYDLLSARKKPFVTTTPDENILEVSKKMVKNGVKRIPVIENDRLVGIISDKEILTISPELIEILSEKMKLKVGNVANPDETISGVCEECDEYSDELKHINGRWLCEDCREESTEEPETDEEEED
jgi:CBS domain-containing protein